MVVPVPNEPRCKNGHLVQREGNHYPVYCASCGVRFRAKHPSLLGVLTGFCASILVSAIEFSTLSYTMSTNSTMGLVVLLGAIPLVFLFSGGIGAVYLKGRYGNMEGVGQILLGTLPVVILFTMLWGVFLLFLAILYSCGTGSC